MHTPGPWIVKNNFNVMGGPEGRRVVANAGGHSDNTIPDHGSQENEDNARLIAAAPELLEACRKYHAAMDTLFAMLIARDPTFFPSRSGEPWAAIEYGHALIRRLTS